MSAGNVLHNRVRLQKRDAMALVSAALSRLVAAHGLGTLSDHAGCGPKTIQNAMGLHSLIELHSLLNVLALDRTALDELLAHFGLKAVALDAADGCEARLLAETADLVAAHARALGDGRIDHREEQALAASARPVVHEWAGRIARADRKRA
jgi:hypothetical protein